MVVKCNKGLLIIIIIISLNLLWPLVEHLACAGELMGVGRLSSQSGGIGWTSGGLLSGGGLGHLIGQTGAAGAGHGRRPTAGRQRSHICFYFLYSYRNCIEIEDVIVKQLK